MLKLPPKNKQKFKKKWIWTKLQSIFKLDGHGFKSKVNFQLKREKEKKEVKREKKRSELKILCIFSIKI